MFVIGIWKTSRNDDPGLLEGREGVGDGPWIGFSGFASALTGLASPGRQNMLIILFCHGLFFYYLNSDLKTKKKAILLTFAPDQNWCLSLRFSKNLKMMIRGLAEGQRNFFYVQT